MTALLTNLISSYGYWIVLCLVGIESVGIPLPGETTLILAAVYAGSTHRLSIVVVIACASAGAIVGDNLGYQIGRVGGYPFLRRYGRYLRLDESRLKLVQYLFQRYGARVVFFGRFVPILRIFAAFLAGTNQMSRLRFVLSNASGGILWATSIGLLGYVLGAVVSGPLTYAGYALAVVITLASSLLLGRYGSSLQEQAEKAFPNPLDSYHQFNQVQKKSAP